MNRFLLVFTAMMAMHGLDGTAKEIYYGSMMESVSLSRETIFRFPLPVRTISPAKCFGIGPTDLSNPDYSLLSVRPLCLKGKSRVVFILSDGSLVRTKLVVSKKEGLEPFIEFRKKSDLLESRENNGPKFSAIEFMKAMDRGGEIVGYEREIKGQRVDTGKVRGVVATLKWIYTGRDYRGFVIELRNRYRTRAYRVDVDKLRFAASEANVAILSMVNDAVLYPKGQGPRRTILKVVAKANGHIEDMILPISLMPKRKVRL